MGYDLTNIFVFFFFAVLFVVVTVSVLSRILRPRSSPTNEPAKTETYECGEPAIGSSWVRFDIRFYMVALVFLIFDVEVAFLYPWAVIFSPLRAAGLGPGMFVFAEVLLFIVILMVGFIYCWRKGDLDWIKSSESQVKAASTRKSAKGRRSASTAADLDSSERPRSAGELTGAGRS